MTLAKWEMGFVPESPVAVAASQAAPFEHTDDVDHTPD